MARFFVIGAGVVGVATAWSLSKAGHQVTLVDRNSGPCGGASLRNGAQLSYSYCDALASPDLLSSMPSILAGRVPAFHVRLQADPQFLLWGLRFMLNSRARAYRGNTRFLLEMAKATQVLLPHLLDEFPLSFDYVVSGKLILCHGTDSWSKAAKTVAMKRAAGIEIKRLDRAEAERIEPALAGYSDDFLGAIHSPDDAVGSPIRFCEGLIAGLQAEYGLRTRFNSEASKVIVRGDHVVGLAFRNGETEACDGVVVATGYDTSLLGGVASFGAIWPVQGYSATVPAGPSSPTVSITDPRRRLVFARLGETMRIAGIADIGPRRFHFDQERYEVLRAASESAFPGRFTFAEGEGWSDARPCTPSSRPLIGRGKIPGVYTNLGHGTLGWTLSLGSARRLAELVATDGA